MIRNRADRDVLDRVGGLLEKEWRFAGWVRTALDRVRGIIAPDTINATDRKHFAFTHDRDRRRRQVEKRLWIGLRLGRNTLGSGAGQRERA